MNFIRTNLLQKLFVHFDKTVLFISALAGAIRWFRPGLFETWIDELTLLKSAADMALSGNWTWVGNPTTFDALAVHSPFSTYVTALPFLITTNPLVVRLFYGLIGTITVVLVYKMIQQYFGKQAAILSSIWLAVAPLPVYWSRFVWNPNLAPPFIILWIWTGLHGYYQSKPRMQILHWIMLSLMIQAQSALAFMIPVSLLTIAVYLYQHPNKRQQTLKQFYIGVIVAFIFAIPWIIGLIGVENGWWDVPVGTSNSRDGAGLAIPSLEKLTRNFALLTSSYNFVFNRLFVPLDPSLWKLPVNLNLLLIVHAIIIAFAVVILPFRLADKSRRFPVIFIICILFWSQFLLFFGGSQNLENFYMQPVVYSTSMIFGIFFTQFQGKKHLLALLIAGILISTQFMFTAAMLNWYAHRDDRLSLAEVQSLLDDWSNLGSEIVFLEGGTYENSRSRSEWLLIWSIYEHHYPLRVVYDTHAFPINSQTQVLATVNDSNLIPEMFGDVQTIRTGKLSLDYAVVTPSMLPSPTFIPDNSNTVSNIMRIQGIVIASATDDNILNLWLMWEPLHPEDNQYQFSVRLLDENNHQYGQVDGAALQNNLWRNGDIVLTQLQLPITALPNTEQLRFHVIVYTLSNMQNQMLLDEAGNPIGDIMVLTSVQ
jgi:4-amino-4-deoxy-L-arabinose transferase-like glycosyltransferase